MLLQEINGIFFVIKMHTMRRMENMIGEKKSYKVEKVLEIVWIGISLEIHFGLGILDFLIACKCVDVKLGSDYSFIVSC